MPLPVINTAATFALNMIYAAINWAIGLLNLNPLFMFTGVFYSVLAVMKCIVLVFAFRGKNRRVMEKTGVLLLALDFALAFVTGLSMVEEGESEHGEIIMISIATYVFTRLVIVIVKAVRSREEGEALFAIRIIGYAEIAVAVLTLQRSMLRTFGTESEAMFVHVMNIVSGAAVSLFIAFIGVYAIRKGKNG